MNAPKTQDAKAKLEEEAKTKKAAAATEAAEAAKEKEDAEAEELKAKKEAEAAEKEAAKAEKGSDKEKAKDMSDRAVQARKSQKAAKMNKRATKKKAERMKKRADLKGTEDDPDAKQFIRIPTDYRDVEAGKEYEFKCHHGRVKFEGNLYEPGETFKTGASKEMIGLVEKGILEIPELPRKA